MIVQAKLHIENIPERFSPSLAYPLYAWLLSQVSAEAGNRLHFRNMLFILIGFIPVYATHRSRESDRNTCDDRNHFLNLHDTAPSSSPS